MIPTYHISEMHTSETKIDYIVIVYFTYKSP